MTWVEVSNIFYLHHFSSLSGEMIQCDEHIFQMGRFNHQVVTKIFLASNMKPSWSIELDFSSFQKISSEDVSIFSPIIFTVEWN